MTDETKPNYLKTYEPLTTIFIYDLIAIPLARMLAALRVHPNMITGLELVVGLVSGIFYAMGLWFWGLALFNLAFLLDCIDGKVARLRGMTSDFGYWFDGVADSARKPSCCLGITVYCLIHNMYIFAGLTVVAAFVHRGIHRLYSLADISMEDLEYPEFHIKYLRRIVPRALALYTVYEEQFLQFTVFPLIAVLVGLPDGAVWFLWGSLVVTLLGLSKMGRVLKLRRQGRYGLAHQRWLSSTGDIDKG